LPSTSQVLAYGRHTGPARAAGRMYADPAAARSGGLMTGEVPCGPPRAAGLRRDTCKLPAPSSWRRLMTA